MPQVVFLYESGRLEEAEHLALKTVDSPGNLTRSELAELYLVLAFCSIANDDEDNSRRHFISALKNNPNLKPDPIGWSPKVRRVFDRAREDWIQISTAEAQRELSLEAEICRQAAFKSMWLPGRGQISKGHISSGWIQSALFWGGLATTIYAHSAALKARDKYHDALLPDDIQNAYNDYRNLSRTAIVAGSFTISVYGFSIFDALWRKPEASIITDFTPRK